MNHKSISSPTAPTGPYSPAVVWQNLVFISGQGPVDSKTGKPVNGDICEQTRQALFNIDQLLQAAGSSRNKVLKVQVYLANIENFSKMNRVYEEFFKGCTFPTRTTIQAGALPGRIGVEIDAIAYRE